MSEIKVIDIEQNTDGSATIHLELSDEFIERFNSIHELEEFDPQKFEEFCIEALETSISDE